MFFNLLTDHEFFKQVGLLRPNHRERLFLRPKGSRSEPC